ncbi:phosphate ABC transporter ATP-binding protein, partial [Candidatus Dependentiae bacterium]|nr:phosphate ABC transporter ATP-binding protein [Candidatus Dependentiae bacterium]
MENQNIQIDVRNLNLYFGKNHILKNLNFTIPEKKITAIIGPSGCGKTTLLKSFNRLIDLQTNVKYSGNIIIDNEDILSKNIEITRVRKKMGLLSQRPFPLPMSIYDNVCFGPRLYGIKSKKELDSIVESHLKEANLWDEVKDKLHSPATKLSVGQQQRLCLARGLAVEPEIVLGDEPTSALDPISSKFIESRFMELKSKYTFVIVTHILRQAKRIADYIIFMYLGAA